MFANWAPQITGINGVTATVSNTGLITVDYDLCGQLTAKSSGGVATATTRLVGSDCKLYALPPSLTVVASLSTTTVTLSGDGTASNPIAANVVLAPAAGLVASAAGVGIKIDPVSCGLTLSAAGLKFDGLTSASNTNTVTLTKTGCGLAADVKIDPSASNLLTSGPSGLLVSSPPDWCTKYARVAANTGAQGVLGAGYFWGDDCNWHQMPNAPTQNSNVSNTTTVLLSGDGSIATPFQASVILQPAGGLIATASGVGLKVDPASLCPPTVSVAGVKFDYLKRPTVQTAMSGKLFVDDTNCVPALLQTSACKYDVLTSDGVAGGVVSWAKPRSFVPVTKKTANYTATFDDQLILVDASAGVVIITLPACAACGPNVFTIKKIDATANSVIVKTVAGLIDGASTKSLSCSMVSVEMVCDGTDYWAISPGSCVPHII